MGYQDWRMEMRSLLGTKLCCCFFFARFWPSFLSSFLLLHPERSNRATLNNLMYAISILYYTSSLVVFVIFFSSSSSSSISPSLPLSFYCVPVKFFLRVIPPAFRAFPSLVCFFSFVFVHLLSPCWNWAQQQKEWRGGGCVMRENTHKTWLKRES